jgi:hypothetical protein
MSMITNLQDTVTAKSARTLLLKEVISIRFDENLRQGENWLSEYDRIHQKKEYDRIQKTSEVRSEAFSLCGVTTFRSYEVL